MDASRYSGYKIDNKDLLYYYGIQVQETLGLFDFPTRKGPTEYDWQDENGVQAFTDEDDIYFGPRDLILKCYIKADSETEFRNRYNMFMAEVISPGLHVLTIPHSDLTYSVYHKDKSVLNRLTKYNANKAIGQFVIPFVEPDPFYPRVMNTADYEFATLASWNTVDIVQTLTTVTKITGTYSGLFQATVGLGKTYRDIPVISSNLHLISFVAKSYVTGDRFKVIVEGLITGTYLPHGNVFYDSGWQDAITWQFFNKSFTPDDPRVRINIYLDATNDRAYFDNMVLYKKFND